MRICPQCGHQNDDDSGFCVGCGTVLGDGGRVYVSLDEPEHGEPTRVVPVPMRPATPPAVSPGFIYALIGALAAAVVLLGIYVVILSGRDDDPANTDIRVAATPLLGSNGIANSPVSEPAARNGEPASNTAAAAANAASTAANAANATANTVTGDRTSRFERSYSGSVGDGGVTMHLTRNGRYLGGRVVPNGRYADIYVEGSVERDGTFAMDERSDLGLVTGVYRGRLNSDGTMTGTWSKPDGDKTRSINLRRK